MQHESMLPVLYCNYINILIMHNCKRVCVCVCVRARARACICLSVSVFLKLTIFVALRRNATAGTVVLRMEGWELR